MKHRALLVLLFVAAPGLGGESSLDPDITAADLIGHIRLLASDAWEGRGTGSPGEEKATNYIADHFQRLGFEPAGIKGTWFQPVPVNAGTEVGDCTLRVVADPPVELSVEKQYRPFSASASGRVEGEVVFVGYGVSAPNLRYDDYDGVDVSGKIVVMFRHVPHFAPQWDRAGRRHAPFTAKLAQAVKRGAIGVVIVNDPWNFPADKKAAQGRGLRGMRPDLPHRGGIGRIQGPSVPFAHMTLAAARTVFPPLFGASPEQLERKIHETTQPAPVAKGARMVLAIQVKPVFDHGRNVCGLLRAKGAGAVDEIIVVGGHHDHLGRGGKGGSLERNPKLRRTIHNGADDNASGTSGVLEIAAYMAARREHLRRSILFMTFTGEERGLVGSRYFVNRPTVPLQKIVAMINMDMIGRLDNKKLFIGGVKTSPVWTGLIARVNETIDLPIVEGAGGRAPSDNTSFYNKGKPVLFFFTGMHENYHRPSDDWNRIDTDGIEKVARLAAGVVDELARSTAPVPFTKADRGGDGPPRPILGISLGQGRPGEVTVGGVAENGPAARAGLRRGDVIVELAGAKITDFRSLRRAMRGRSIGETIKVKLRRDGKEIEVEVELGSSAD